MAPGPSTMRSLGGRETFEFGVWHQKPQTEQAQVLWRVAELLEAQADDLAQL